MVPCKCFKCVYNACLSNMYIHILNLEFYSKKSLTHFSGCALFSACAAMIPHSLLALRDWGASCTLATPDHFLKSFEILHRLFNVFGIKNITLHSQCSQGNMYFLVRGRGPMVIISIVFIRLNQKWTGIFFGILTSTLMAIASGL